MSYVDIVLTSDKRLYIAPPWSTSKGDVVEVTTRNGDKVIKTVERTITQELGGEHQMFLEALTGNELKKVDAVFAKTSAAWEEDTSDVSE
jgi:hypothetical protein